MFEYTVRDKVLCTRVCVSLSTAVVCVCVCVCSAAAVVLLLFGKEKIPIQ